MIEAVETPNHPAAADAYAPLSRITVRRAEAYATFIASLGSFKIRFCHSLLLTLVPAFTVCCGFSGEAPASSPKHRLCFVSEQYGHPELMWSLIDGGERRRLTTTAQHVDNVEPSVSPTGDRIAFISNRDGTDNVFVMDLQAETTIQLTHLEAPAFAKSPVWSPDGNRIGYLRSLAKRDSFGRPRTLEIFAIDLKSGVETQLTKDWELGPNRIDWHRKENKLVFVSNKWGDMNSAFVLDLNCAKCLEHPQSAAVLAPAMPMGYFSFSPDSADRLVAAGGPSSSIFDIYLIQRKSNKGVEFTRLTVSKPGDNCRLPAWSPDGQFIAYTCSIAGGDHLYLMDVNGSNQRRLSAAESREYDPAWFPRVTK